MEEQKINDVILFDDREFDDMDQEEKEPTKEELENLQKQIDRINNEFKLEYED